jgi:hypothetical protein
MSHNAGKAGLARFVIAIIIGIFSLHAHACTPPALPARGNAANAATLAAKQFADCARNVGVFAATDKYLDENGWLVTPTWGALRPRMTRAHAMQHTAQQADTRLARWEVVQQEHAPKSDLLIQTGRWQSAVNSDAGDFLVAWRVGTNGQVRLAFGMLVRDTAFAPPLIDETASASVAAEISGRGADAITLGELQFGSICGASGMSAAFDSFGANNVMVIRTGGSLTGKTNAVNDARIKTERWRYIPQQSAIDKASALAYVFGRYSMTTIDGQTERGYFARIWKLLPKKDARDFSNWRVIVDAASPLSLSRTVSVTR